MKTYIIIKAVIQRVMGYAIGVKLYMKNYLLKEFHKSYSLGSTDENELI